MFASSLICHTSVGANCKTLNQWNFRKHEGAFAVITQSTGIKRYIGSPWSRTRRLSTDTGVCPLALSRSSVKHSGCC